MVGEKRVYDDPKDVLKNLGRKHRGPEGSLLIVKGLGFKTILEAEDPPSRFIEAEAVPKTDRQIGSKELNAASCLFVLLAIVLLAVSPLSSSSSVEAASGADPQGFLLSLLAIPLAVTRLIWCIGMGTI